MQKGVWTECKLEIPLVLHASDDQQLDSKLRVIAAASTSLRAGGIVVNLHLRPDKSQSCMPEPETFRQLAPFLADIPYHVVTDLSDPDPSLAYTSSALFTDAHATAVTADTTQLRNLCLSDHSFHSYGSPVLTNSISAIARLQALTRLHLSFRHSQPDFQPLAQLENLDDLALQCQGHNSSCCGVLDSNKNSLRRVVLASDSWDSLTFQALLGAESLEHLTLKVHSLATDTAQTLSCMMAPSTIQIMLQRCLQMEAAAFTALSSGQAKITLLSLWRVDNIRMRALASMPNLQSLVIVRPDLSFKGADMQYQPVLASLVFLSWFQVRPPPLPPSLPNSHQYSLKPFSCMAFQFFYFGRHDLFFSVQVSDHGVEWLVSILPNLINFEIHQEVGFAPNPIGSRPTLSSQGLALLAKGSKLIHIGLEGLCDISEEKRKLLKACFGTWQAAGLTQHLVVVHMPLPDSMQASPKVIALSHLHYPLFGHSWVPQPNWERGEKLEFTFKGQSSDEKARALKRALASSATPRLGQELIGQIFAQH